jgi:hypothetical protein
MLSVHDRIVPFSGKRMAVAAATADGLAGVRPPPAAGQPSELAFIDAGLRAAPQNVAARKAGNVKACANVKPHNLLRMVFSCLGGVSDTVLTGELRHAATPRLPGPEAQ